jgi:HAD superfamily hydrolase (TIGR01509 family)
MRAVAGPAAEREPSWAVVFDLDGVLVESEGAWDAARRDLVAATGGTWREGATRAMLGMSAPEWSRYVHEQLGVPLSPEEIDRRVVERVLEEYRAALPLLPGALTAVHALASSWPLGLASSSNRVVIDEVLRLSGLEEDFAVTVSSEEVARGKPAPDVYIAAVKALGVAARCAVAIEDSANGLRSAAAAGLRLVAVPNRELPPDGDALALADVVLPSLEELSPATIRSLQR